MDSRSLSHFLKLAERLSFTKTAEELYISQPTLSREVQSLEAELGVKLFNRNSNGLTLTAEAIDLIPFIRQYLQYGEYVKTLALKKEHGLSGIIQLGYTGMADSRLVSLILRQAYEQSPEIEVNLRLVSHTKLLLMLREGQLDAALTLEPVVKGITGISYTTLIQKKTWVVFPSWHPMAKKKQITPQELRDIPLIFSAYSDSPFLNTVVSKIYNENGIELKMITCNSDPQSINYIVQAGKGASLSLCEKSVLVAQGLSVVELVGSWKTPVVLAMAENKGDWPLLNHFTELAIQAGAEYVE